MEKNLNKRLIVMSLLSLAVVTLLATTTLYIVKEKTEEYKSNNSKILKDEEQALNSLREETLKAFDTANLDSTTFYTLPIGSANSFEETLEGVAKTSNDGKEVAQTKLANLNKEEKDLILYYQQNAQLYNDYTSIVEYLDETNSTVLKTAVLIKSLKPVATTGMTSSSTPELVKEYQEKANEFKDLKTELELVELPEVKSSENLALYRAEIIALLDKYIEYYEDMSSTFQQSYDLTFENGQLRKGRDRETYTESNELRKKVSGAGEIIKIEKERIIKNSHEKIKALGMDLTNKTDDLNLRRAELIKDLK